MTSDDDQTYGLLDPPPPEDPPPPPGPPAVEGAKPCPSCGYDLRGLRSSKCPECGEFYRDALEKKRDRVRIWDDLMTFRWVVIGAVPMAIWALLLLIVVRLGMFHTAITVRALGMLVAIAAMIWAGKSAGEEGGFEADAGAAFMVAVLTAVVNVIILTAVQAALQF